MASNVKQTGELAVAEKALPADYNRDFYSWLMEQAQHLRAGKWDAIDRDNLAEEVESLGPEQFNKLESAFRVLLNHFLKWDHQPSKRSRSWMLSIKAQRLELGEVLDDNPDLKPRIEEALARAYRKARIQAARETRLEETAFPEACHYSFEDVVSRQFTL
jgi:hypothetical protein